MFGRKLDEILMELRSQKSVRGTLERQIKWLEAQNRDLMNRLMARDFTNYVYGDSELSSSPLAESPEDPEARFREEDIAGSIIEE